MSEASSEDIAILAEFCDLIQKSRAAKDLGKVRGSAGNWLSTRVSLGDFAAMLPPQQGLGSNLGVSLSHRLHRLSTWSGEDDVIGLLASLKQDPAEEIL